MTPSGPAEVAYRDGKADLTSKARADYYHYLAISIAIDIDNGIAITSEVYAKTCREARTQAMSYAEADERQSTR